MAGSTAVRFRNEARPRLVLSLARRCGWHRSSARLLRRLPGPYVAGGPWARQAPVSHAAAGHCARWPGTMGTLWPPGQVPGLSLKAKGPSCCVHRGPPGGQGRAILSPPWVAQGAIRGLALEPRALATWSRPGAFSHSSASHSTPACSGSWASRTTTSRSTVRAPSRAKGSVQPWKGWAPASVATVPPPPRPGAGRGNARGAAPQPGPRRP
jgi:hypothetical protein